MIFFEKSKIPSGAGFCLVFSSVSRGYDFGFLMFFRLAANRRLAMDPSPSPLSPAPAG
jgi:hypothetical protein